MPDKTDKMSGSVCEIVLSTILEPASALFRTAVRSAPEDTLEEDIPGALLHHVAL